MQFETNSLTDAVKEFIGIMKDSGLSYMYVKNDKFELELGQKNPPPAPPVMPAMPPMAMAAAPAVPTSAPQTQAPAAAPADTGKSIKSPIVGTFYFCVDCLQKSLKDLCVDCIILCQQCPLSGKIIVLRFIFLCLRHAADL